eukprot:10180960-Heterocapsa_arctica.AAC.1
MHQIEGVGEAHQPSEEVPKPRCHAREEPDGVAVAAHQRDEQQEKRPGGQVVVLDEPFDYRAAIRIRAHEEREPAGNAR